MSRKIAGKINEEYDSLMVACFFGAFLQDSLGSLPFLPSVEQRLFLSRFCFASATHCKGFLFSSSCSFVINLSETLGKSCLHAAYEWIVDKNTGMICPSLAATRMLRMAECRKIMTLRSEQTNLTENVIQKPALELRTKPILLSRKITGSCPHRTWSPESTVFTELELSRSLNNCISTRTICWFRVPFLRYL